MLNIFTRYAIYAQVLLDIDMLFIDEGHAVKMKFRTCLLSKLVCRANFSKVGMLFLLIFGGASCSQPSKDSDLETKMTLVIAEHRAARLAALYEMAPELESRLNVKLKVVEYPAPAKDYFTKLVTELRSGNAPDVFSVPRDLQLDDLAAAGYLADLTSEMQDWEGYSQLPELIKTLTQGSFDKKNYVVPSIVAVEQLYYRHDLLTKYGIDTSQPKTLQELTQRAEQIKEKTAKYAMLFPAGLTWGMGSYTEGFRYLLAGRDDYSLLTSDGRYDLSHPALVDSFQFYADLVSNQFMPVNPLLNPEPWVIPKYEMFPNGDLMITTCGTWCVVFDWGENSRNPIANIDKAVATWKIPAQNGKPFVLASLVYSWAVNDKSRQKLTAKKLALAMGEVDVAIAYAKRLGNVPARMDAKYHPGYPSLGNATEAHQLLPEARAVTTTVGASAVISGVARATEGLLTQRVDAKGAEDILRNYVTSVLGEERVKGSH
ncbi:extracellular solute-binding protein [Paraglaciecola sp.]|uniref:ABC transporter substrate-binding protein n=1 Tax=Paraglaciecola sp. TaxID=1920173 RepID=UPI003266AC7A